MSKAIVVLSLLLCACPGEADTSADLSRWLANWESARSCLLPRQRGDTRTAVAIQSLSEPALDCAASLDALRAVPVGVDPANVWADAIAAAGKLSRARQVEDVAREIDRIDDAARLLRFAFGLTPVIHPPRGAARPLPRGETLAIGGVDLADDVHLTLQGGAVSGRAVRGDVVDFFGTELPKIREYPHAADEVVAYPSGTVVRGALAAASRGDTTVSIHAAPAGARHAYTVEVRDREGVRRNPIAQPRAQLVGVTQWPVSGDMFVLLRDPDALRVHAYQPGERAWPAATNLDNGWYQTPHFGQKVDCRTRWYAWSLERDRLVRIDRFHSKGLPPSSVSRARDRDLDCGDDRAVVLAHDPDRLEHCERGTCAEESVAAPGHRGVVAIDPSDRWVYAAQAGSVIGIWRPTDRQFFQLAEPARLYGVIVLDRTYLVVVARDRRYRFIELPPDA